MINNYSKVFGIGLNKTGTTTLGQCLQLFGLNHMSCRKDLLIALRNQNLESIFTEVDKYDSFEDWPYPLMYQELWDRYGADARYILTKRKSPQVWLESLKSHSLRTDPDDHCRELAYGYNYPHEAEDEHINMYLEHNSSVKSFFQTPEKRAYFLEVTWENGDGWRELCTFLGYDIPDIDFPHANKAKLPDSKRRMENLHKIRTE